MFIKLIKLTGYFCIILFFIAICFLGYVFYDVTRDASMSIERGAIDRVIASESRVFYDDGKTPIGVFFEKTHRKYVRYDEIPKIFIKALIAAEDSRFFEHPGFDIRAMLRAFIRNMAVGEVIQGGSTITQQTAKNVFRRERRSYRAKLKELIQAVLLERKYSKQEILEMYCNQFFVTGYGKGLKIAAEYFFGKELKDLNLVEAAFIAGSVKAPNRYNPFIKKSDSEKRKAARLAKLRKDYVLSRMLRMNFITSRQFNKAINAEIPFKEGRITYRLNVILDYIRGQLESDYFRSILKEQGVENVATSGITIYTSINKKIEEGALETLRRRLQLLDVELAGYRPVQKAGLEKKLAENSFKKSKSTLPFLARITNIENARRCRLVVSWDHGGGIIDSAGLIPICRAWVKWKFGKWAVFKSRHLSMFLKNFHVGDVVAVQNIPSRDKTGATKLMLALIPELEGGIVVLHDGMIKAMVGGFSNSFFNRVVDAKRQLGSIFKPIVYTAALQLKWNTLDSLLNRRDVYRFENTFYVPRPDHPPKSEHVSMVWAGAKSENLATVWLLYHLTDRLNMDEFRNVVRILGLNRKEEESYDEYKSRIRDKHGVVVNSAAIKEAAFEESKKEVETDVIFDGQEGIINNIKRLHYILDKDKIYRDKPDKYARHILRFSFHRLRRLNQKMKTQLEAVNQLIQELTRERNPAIRKVLQVRLKDFYRADDGGNHLIYMEDRPDSGRMRPLTPEWAIKRHAFLSPRNIWIDDLVTSHAVELLDRYTKKNYDRLAKVRGYDPEVLYKIRDFKTLVNLSYVVMLSRKMGISSHLDPVLSFPLGPNSISIIEAALAYQTIMSDQVYPLGNDTSPSNAPVITKITDREGEVLWEYRPAPRKVLTGRVSRLVTEILGKVMEFGTGKRANGAVRLMLNEDGEEIGVSIPGFGKTGTSNRFTNSSFVGFIPGFNKRSGKLDNQKGYVIAAYVGYDDNRPMKGKQITIYGASGALPLWIDTANAIVNTDDYKKDLQPADLAFDMRDYLFPTGSAFQEVPVSPMTGLPFISFKHTTKANSSSLPRVFANIATGIKGKQALIRRFEPFVTMDVYGQ